MEEEMKGANQSASLIYTNIHYYNKEDEITELEFRCPSNENGELIIDDNTVYEIDSECYKYLERKRARRKYR